MEEAFFVCPHCWERVSILADTSLDGRFRFVEDCEVCCNPLTFDVTISQGAVVGIEAEPAQ